MTKKLVTTHKNNRKSVHRRSIKRKTNNTINNRVITYRIKLLSNSNFTNINDSNYSIIPDNRLYPHAFNSKRNELVQNILKDRVDIFDNIFIDRLINLISSKLTVKYDFKISYSKNDLMIIYKIDPKHILKIMFHFDKNKLKPSNKGAFHSTELRLKPTKIKQIKLDKVKIQNFNKIGYERTYIDNTTMNIKFNNKLVKIPLQQPISQISKELTKITINSLNELLINYFSIQIIDIDIDNLNIAKSNDY